MGKDAILKTALLPALTMGVKNAAPYVGADAVKDVPLAVRGCLRQPRGRGRAPRGGGEAGGGEHSA